ncbi:MAG: ABC transporter ATP-binding protein [Nanoarchaeota archaeon]
MNALTIKGLRKTYKTGVEAVKDIDLEIKEGDFFGLLGPNGAGKTTIIGIITGLVNKTSGTVKVFDKDIDEAFDEAKRLIGVVPQEMNFSIFEKVWDIVCNQGGYYGIPRHVVKQRTIALLKQLGLWDKRFTVARTLSGGMKRRLMIARGLIHEPKLLILDEPTAGVDVELRRGMWEFLEKISGNGTTIILTTHYLEEAEQLCNNIAIIHQGKIIENSSKKELIGRLDKQSYILDLKETLTSVPPLKDHAIKKIDETTIEVELHRNQDISRVFKHLHEHNIKILSLRNKTNRLEELFLDLVEGGP